MITWDKPCSSRPEWMPILQFCSRLYLADQPWSLLLLLVWDHVQTIFNVAQCRRSAIYSTRSGLWMLAYYTNKGTQANRSVHSSGRCKANGKRTIRQTAWQRPAPDATHQTLENMRNQIKCTCEVDHFEIGLFCVFRWTQPNERWGSREWWVWIFRGAVWALTISPCCFSHSSRLIRLKVLKSKHLNGAYYVDGLIELILPV